MWVVCLHSVSMGTLCNMTWEPSLEGCGTRGEVVCGPSLRFVQEKINHSRQTVNFILMTPSCVFSKQYSICVSVLSPGLKRGRAWHWSLAPSSAEFAACMEVAGRLYFTFTIIFVVKYKKFWEEQLYLLSLHKLTVDNIQCHHLHTTFHPTPPIGSKVAPTSEIWTPAILKWLKLRNLIAWNQGRLQCHHLHTKFNPNPPNGSKVIKVFLYTHLRSLNVRHFGMAEATILKKMWHRGHFEW
jgi:hypothetical protein